MMMHKYLQTQINKIKTNFRSGQRSYFSYWITIYF